MNSSSFFCQVVVELFIYLFHFGLNFLILLTQNYDIDWQLEFQPILTQYCTYLHQYYIYMFKVSKSLEHMYKLFVNRKLNNIFNYTWFYIAFWVMCLKLIKKVKELNVSDNSHDMFQMVSELLSGKINT